MKISHYQLRTLIESVILEGFKNDQQYLAEKYPESAQDIFRLQPKWISWLMVRFGDSPTQKEIHPFSDAIVTVLNFSKKDAAIGEKWKSNEQFRAAINARFPEGERAWRSPADAMTMTVDQMELILGLYERKKQRIELKDENFESDRVGKVGPWNIWLPTTRENSCKIAGYDPVTLEPKTTWCTARTSGSNAFYNYVGRSGREITLFYIIKDNPIGNEDWLSVGFFNGKPELDGKDGSMSVDRKNIGLTKGRLKSILGPYHNEIMNIMVEKNKSLGGKHPAREKMIAATQSVEALEYLLQGLSKDEVNDMKSYIASNEDLALDVMKELLANGNENVKINIAVKKNIPPEILYKLVKDEESVRSILSRNENIPIDLMYKFSEDPSQSVRAAVANNKNVPIDILRKLATDSDSSVRTQVAMNQKTPSDIIHKLTKDSNNMVVIRAIQSKNVPLEDYYEVLKGNFDFGNYIAGNTRVPSDILDMIASSRSNDARMAVSRNKNTSADTLRKLATDPEVIVRGGVASNAKTPIDIIRQLATDSEDFVRKNVAENQNVPLDILDTLMTDESERVRQAAKKNPNAKALIKKLRK